MLLPDDEQPRQRLAKRVERHPFIVWLIAGAVAEKNVGTLAEIISGARHRSNLPIIIQRCFKKPARGWNRDLQPHSRLKIFAQGRLRRDPVSFYQRRGWHTLAGGDVENLVFI